MHPSTNVLLARRKNTPTTSEGTEGAKVQTVKNANCVKKAARLHTAFFKPHLEGPSIHIMLVSNLERLEIADKSQLAHATRQT